jgi:hypothetical protein
MPEPANITRPAGQNKGVVRCQCYRCGAALEFDLSVASQQQQPQQPSWPSARPQGQKQQPARHQQPQPWTPQRARSFILPIGRFKGQTLDAVYGKDPRYVKWPAATVGRGVGRAAQNYLELCVQPERN